MFPVDMQHAVLFDSGSGALGVINMGKQELRLLLEPSITSNTRAHETLCVMKASTEDQRVKNLLSVTYEENRSSMVVGGTAGKSSVRTCLKRYEMNEQYIRALFLEEDHPESLRLSTSSKKEL